MDAACLQPRMKITLAVDVKPLTEVRVSQVVELYAFDFQAQITAQFTTTVDAFRVSI